MGRIQAPFRRRNNRRGLGAGDQILIDGKRIDIDDIVSYAPNNMMAFVEKRAFDGSTASSISSDSVIIAPSVIVRESQLRMPSSLSITVHHPALIKPCRRALVRLLAVILSILSACSSTRVLERWPESLPEEHHFLNYYLEDVDNQKVQTDVQYLTWVLRFYEGWELMPTGWQNIEENMLFDLPAQEHALVTAQMAELGALISAEWAKDNSVRLIDSVMLSLWGAVMQVDFASQARIAALTQIHADVRGLLEGHLTPPTINEQRYVDTLGVLLEP